MNSVSVVIPNFNGRQLLERYLPAVEIALRHPSVSASEIIVSDDCSTDDSVAFLHKNYPNVIVIESARNEGFAPASNRGIARATMDYVLMLPDMLLKIKMQNAIQNPIIHGLKNFEQS